VFLLLTLSGNTTLIPQLVRECRLAVEKGGGELLEQRPDCLLLNWPARLGEQQLLSVWQYLLANMRALAPHMQFHAAASLGWVKSRSADSGGHRYRGEVLRQVVGILREGQQLGSSLLISAALHHRLDRSTSFHYQLHVAFKVEGHRYPATLYQITADSFC
jgi:hypothetical protein